MEENLCDRFEGLGYGKLVFDARNEICMTEA